MSTRPRATDAKTVIDGDEVAEEDGILNYANKTLDPLKQTDLFEI